MSGITNQSDSPQTVKAEEGEKLRKTEQPEDSKDFFAFCQQNIEKLIDGIKQIVPKYYQSITNVQQECLNTCESFLSNQITLQREYVTKLGLSVMFQMHHLIIRDATEEFVKATNIQNQISLAAIDATQQNIKAFNDNAKSFSDLNKNILKSWFSVSIFSRNN